jgi:hypothetical protein
MELDLKLSKFTMLRLDIFQWTPNDDSWNYPLLKHTQLPPLRVLCWGENRSAWRLDVLTEEFFRRLPECLEEYEIVGQAGPRNYRYLLTHVRKLSLWHCSLVCTSCVLGYFVALNYLMVILSHAVPYG